MMILKKGVGNDKDTDDFRSIFTKISIASVSSQVILFDTFIGFSKMVDQIQFKVAFMRNMSHHTR